MPSLQIRRQRTMALERFKIINQLTPVCLQNLVNVKKSKYSFKYNNIVDIHEVKTTTYGKKSFRYAASAMWNSLPDHFRTDSSFSQFKSLIHSIQSWNGTECRCSVCRKVKIASFLMSMFVFMLLSAYSYYVFNFMLLYACSLYLVFRLSVLYSSYLF